MTPQKKVLIGIVLVFLFIILYYIVGCPGVRSCPFFISKADPPKKVYLSFIGPWDSEDDWEKIIAKFNAYKKQKENGYIDVIIEYERIDDWVNYEDIVREKQYEGEGPNLFTVYHSWVKSPRFEKRILPAPKDLITPETFRNTYAKAAVKDLIGEDGTIYSLPLYIDTLALYYNNDMFSNESLPLPPKDWREFTQYVEKLTYLEKDENDNLVYDKNGNPQIKLAGAAFGGAENVNRSQDIVMLLVMQNNYEKDNLVSFRTKEAETAVKFYTDFADPKNRFYTWNSNQMFSIDAFTQRKTAMMINYYSQARNVDEKTGGKLNYKIAPMPQLNETRKINYASYWVPVVANNAPCRTQVGLKLDCYALSWEFLDFAAKKKNVMSYLESSDRIAANLEIAGEQIAESDIKKRVFAEQVFTAETWDNPDNETADSALIEMIDSIITGNDDKKLEVKRAIEIPKRYIEAVNF